MTIEIESRLLGIPVQREKVPQGVTLPLCRPYLAYTRPRNDVIVEGVKGILVIPEKQLPDIVVEEYTVEDDNTFKVTTKRSYLSYTPEFRVFQRRILKREEINRAGLEFPTKPYIPQPNPNPMVPPLQPWRGELYGPARVRKRLSWRQDK